AGGRLHLDPVVGAVGRGGVALEGEAGQRHVVGLDQHAVAVDRRTVYQGQVLTGADQRQRPVDGQGRGQGEGVGAEVQLAARIRVGHGEGQVAPDRVPAGGVDGAIEAVAGQDLVQVRAGVFEHQVGAVAGEVD